MNIKPLIDEYAAENQALRNELAVLRLMVTLAVAAFGDTTKGGKTTLKIPAGARALASSFTDVRYEFGNKDKPFTNGNVTITAVVEDAAVTD